MDALFFVFFYEDVRRLTARATHLSTERGAYGIADGYRNALLTVKATLSICHCRHLGLVSGSILLSFSYAGRAAINSRDKGF